MTETSHFDPASLLMQRVISGELELPLLPTVAVEVLGLVDGECDVRELADLVQNDPALAAHVLRVSNSARYAPKAPIVSLAQAIGRLGLTRFREMVISVAVKTSVFDVKGHESRVDALWQHAAVTAGLAKEVARARRVSVEAGYLAGLLHDIGAPVVLQGCVDIAKQQGREVSDGELDALIGELHESVGKMLVERWGLADWVQAAVSHHHEPRGEHEELVRTVALADGLAYWLVEDEGEGQPPGIEHAEALDLYSEDIEALCACGESMLSEAAEV